MAIKYVQLKTKKKTTLAVNVVNNIEPVTAKKARTTKSTKK